MNLKTSVHQGFWSAYLSSKKSILLLVLVCCIIAFVTHLFNGLSFLINVGFSFCFGFPISMIETFLRTRQRPLSDNLINVLAVLLGCVFGTICVYGYLVFSGLVPFGYIGSLFFVNFGIAFVFSAAAFYFFWSRYRNQALTLALRDQQLKAAELENLRQVSENRLLQSQMEPHFLFNTLANIQSLIDIDPAIAKHMIGDLSNMLRSSLKNSSQDWCTLGQELSLVRAYISIQKVRIGERLVMHEVIDDDLMEIKVPPMLIQPLVENAIRHGVEKSVQAVDVTLSVQKVGSKLEVTVDDTGKAQSHSEKGHGLSLANIRKRLQNRFSEDAHLSAQPVNGGWQSKLVMPILSNEEITE